MDNIVVLAQARLGSTRYPRKVLAPLCGIPLVLYQARRFQQAGWRMHVLVPKGDKALVALKREGIAVHGILGDPEDVLLRFATYAHAMLKPSSIIVRVCCDSPLLCPYLLGAILAQWEASSKSLAYLGMGSGWPDGLADFDVFTYTALMQAHAEATLASDRHHCTPLFWKQPDRFPQSICPAPSWVREQAWPKFSIDTPEDFAYVERVAQHVTQVYGRAYTWRDVLMAVTHEPSLYRMPEPMNEAYVTQVAQERGQAEITWEHLRYAG
mgnify:CR=1 FL=1